ncbi:MAG: prepilin-type N-terminal cleavage/methylation domain-containing protein [Kiritimatiellae bacterium]|nr:prepilin-type N-terminal cleavage/methylation domain-containing protein [Kiritimatiellia bacterium]
MKHSLSRRGFTLMEVNLAIFIMAVGVLGMVALYPLGFRESRHARDDVYEAAVADGILNPLVAALSDCASNITWSAWKDIAGNNENRPIFPDQGWLAYCDTQTYTPKTKAQINSQTRTVISRIGEAYKGSGNPASDARSILDNSGMVAALVISSGELPTLDGTGGTYSGYHVDRSRLVLCLRLARHANQLFEQPAFYTEVHYQGDPGIQTAGGN